MNDLDDVLGEVSETTEEVSQPETIGQPRDETGKFAPKETGVEPQPETVVDTVPPTADKLPKEDYKAIREEREKRQALERELEQLKTQLQSRPVEPPAPPPSVWEDEQGFQGHIVSTAVQQASLNARLDMSEMMTRQANADFDDMKAKFLEMASQNPSLQQQCLSDPHPWHKAYTIAKNAAKMEALGATDVTELEAKLREQIAAELATKPAAPTLPTSLADAQSARSSTMAQGPLTLDDILGRKG
jgi:hypothetical protein